ncbi:hypothetical protein [uncultured Acetobacteroides sp.]|uniref:hypothetical protein n=1 Tax=uncultured Acetobacteroides sp. TaxID=1760811 RepID=UPI0029F49B4C|nr:hypothetical protein [uncultured Acetobacteroides sp.]
MPPYTLYLSYFSLNRQQQISILSSSKSHLFQPIDKRLKALLLLLLLMLLTTPQIRAQRFAVGAETGFYAISQEKFGVGLGKASGLYYGIAASYYPNERVAINMGINSMKFDLWDGSRYVQIPLNVSYALTKRGKLRDSEKKSNNLGSILFDLLTFGFFPQTLEVESGLSLGLYNGSYSCQFESTQPTWNSSNSKLIESQYLVTRKNHQAVPSFDLGVRWSYDFESVHLILHSKYYYLFSGDSKVIMEELSNHKKEENDSHSAFSISVALVYSL